MAEVKHKLMRTETVLDILNECYRRDPQNFRRNFMEQVLGMIVLTRYNNKTYRINDVLFDENPNKTFETPNGPISYIDYYRVCDFFQYSNYIMFLYQSYDRIVYILLHRDMVMMLK